MKHIRLTHKLRAGLAASSLVLGLMGAGVAQAQDFPSHPIDLIAASQAGAPNDLLSRKLAELMEKRGGPTLVIENLTGAGSLLAGQKLVNSPADGYTLGIFNEGLFVIMPLVKADLEFDPNEAMEPISVIGTLESILVANPALGIHSVEEMIAAASKEPNKYTYASVGAGSSQHIKMATILGKTGLQMRHIPYKGGNNALQATMSGEVDFYVSGATTTFAPIADGRLAPIGLLVGERSKFLPDVPTLKEQGVDYDDGATFIIFAPKGVPEDIKAKLREEISLTLADPAFAEGIKPLGMSVNDMSPEEIQALITREYTNNKATLGGLGLLAK